MTRFARALPALRERVEADLEGDGLGRERVLACAVRLLDRGFFRVGGEAYTDSFGLATIRKEHVSFEDGQTWNATVSAAVALAVSGTARSSYIDPRVFDAYRAGDVLDPAVLDLPARQPRIERAMLDLVAQVSSG